MQKEIHKGEITDIVDFFIAHIDKRQDDWW